MYNAILRDLQCLHPLVRKKDEGKTAIARLGLHLRQVTKSHEMCDKVKAEWIMYMCERDSNLVSALEPIKKHQLTSVGTGIKWPRSATALVRQISKYCSPCQSCLNIITW